MSGPTRQTDAPVAALLDLLGRRWAMRVLWELKEPATFRELQARCGGVSSSVLNQRLRELADAGIVTTGYRLTHKGEALLAALAPLKAWAREHRRERAHETEGAAS
jgi:DNA-binding HxlR family transcriptional regulator